MVIEMKKVDQLESNIFKKPWACCLYYSTKRTCFVDLRNLKDGKINTRL